MKSILADRVVLCCATSREIFHHWITVEIIVTRFAFVSVSSRGGFLYRDFIARVIDIGSAVIGLR